jgi:aminopeptidase N
MSIRLRSAALFILYLIFTASVALSQQAQEPPPNPFAAPLAKFQYAPDRDYDLLHVALDMNVDYAKLSFQATVTNTISPLRDGLTLIRFHCGANLNVEAVEIDGRKAAFTHDGDILKIIAPQSLVRANTIRVSIRYTATGEKIDGFHWVKATSSYPDRAGFWTAGQQMRNRSWIPTWDYPNDFATTETRVTVPASWQVFGNGALKSDSLSADKQTRTFHWQMEQPHATYLLSLAAGQFDIKTADWRGVPLIYAVPKGKGHMIDDTFGETPEMLSFYTDLLGVEYPWPKYAQIAVYEFRGGLENLSATIFGDYLLAGKRIRISSGIVAHEIAHQWFGDLVTYKHWGEFWLGEGFAFFFGQLLYAEHWQGKAEYDHQVAGAMRDYFAESRRYKRPLSTNFYESADAMLDQHSYLKGAVVLHTLRRHLGDKLFFEGMRHYLNKYRNTPVDSHDLCDALTEGTGINLEPFFAQWVFKPGHPVLDYTWTWDDTKKEVVLNAKQTQETKDGAPIYDLNLTVGMISGGRVTREKVEFDQAEQTIRIAASAKPDAVLLDPDHDFLREIPTLHWSAEEASHILKYAPNAVDRQEAMKMTLAGAPSNDAIKVVVEALRADNGKFPVFRSIERLGELNRPELRSFFREQLTHPAYQRRAQGTLLLGRLTSDQADIQALRSLINDQETYEVIGQAVRVLKNWDAAGNQDIFKKAAQVVLWDEGFPIRALSFDALAQADAAEGKPEPDPVPQVTAKLRTVMSEIANGGKEASLLTEGLRDFAANPNFARSFTSWLKDMKSFKFLQQEDLEERGSVKRGEKVVRVYSYKMITGQMTLYLGFPLAADGRAADILLYR